MGDWLAEAEEVPLAVVEPSGALADPTAGVAPRHQRQPPASMPPAGSEDPHRGALSRFVTAGSRRAPVTLRSPHVAVVVGGGGATRPLNRCTVRWPTRTASRASGITIHTGAPRSMAATITNPLNRAIRMNPRSSTCRGSRPRGPWWARPDACLARYTM